MELRQALSQVAEIREHLARTEVFCGYRSLTVGFSGVVGLATAAIQAVWLPRPTEQLTAYLALWAGAAILSLLVVGIEMWFLTRRARGSLTRERTLFAIEQIVPALVVGGLVSTIIFQRASDVAWMLPGLWSLLFSLAFLLPAGCCRDRFLLPASGTSLPARWP